jgi:hypothetical protein
MSTLLWVVAPYVALTSFVLGHIWRYRYDKFGWTTRSSQMYESHRRPQQRDRRRRGQPRPGPIAPWQCSVQRSQAMATRLVGDRR